MITDDITTGDEKWVGPELKFVYLQLTLLSSYEWKCLSWVDGLHHTATALGRTVCYQSLNLLDEGAINLLM